MSLSAIIYLVIVLVFLIGGFIFFIIMDLKSHKEAKKEKLNKEEK